MGALKQPVTYTAAEYLALEQTADFKSEFVDGYIYAMSGASENHNLVTLNIGSYLRNILRGQQSCRVFMSDMRLEVNAGQFYYYPDVMLTCEGKGDDPYHKRNPCLLVEVTSPSTKTVDYREKLRHYLAIPSLRYYLIAAPDVRKVEYFQRNANGEWESGILEENEILLIDCSSLQCGLQLRDVYADMDVPER
ncbi:Uma2 family endonuclease [Thiothrix subterranea]|uniref:Uma2 family endonuclease n=1 Tax=Thiothrix subterranea TaxID=2735563 RepID=A0AA51MMI6_9GAMM|nr:Uma2 family endonuclease [Thiothrix subterranea]MDQ5769533.1 Uma2 family endonuclease [Thiothrix subterranea]WML87117.1 Uma2 family endonuclease [Thiothrix subterranea]